MDLDRALEHAIAGDALLFAGAGFSLGARNLRNSPFKTGSQLAAHLAELAGLPNDTSLEDAAEELAQRTGTDTLVKEIRQEFTAGEVTNAHIQISGIPWKRIYTTNYDNVLETAYHRSSRALAPVTLGDRIQDIPKNDTLCVHLNGYVERLTRDNLWSEIKLTDTSYLTASLSDSPWIVLFRQDLQLARAVFFVGYSLAGDLDIKRIVYESSTLKEKCFFVLGSHPSDSTRRRAERFGTVLELDSLRFAAGLQDKKRSYTPPLQSEHIEYCVRRFHVSSLPETFSDRSIFDLLLFGDVKPQFVWHSLHGGRRYFLHRSIGERAFRHLEEGSRAIVVHSDLGNGKSLIVEGLKCKGVESGYEVYDLAARTSDLLSELECVVSRVPKMLMVVENYPDWLDALEYFSIHASDKSAVVLSARTSVHDFMVDRLVAVLRTDSVPEFAVDQLVEAEREWIIDFFNEYGLWAKRAAWSRRQKQKFLAETCRSQFHAILLKLLSSPQILKRFDAVLTELSEKQDYHRIVIAILILTVLEYWPSVNTLADLCGDRVFDPQFRRNRAINELVDFAHGRARLRSSVAAQFILQEVPAATTVEVLVDLAHRADRNAGLREYSEMLKRLMRFGHLQDVLPEKQRRQAILRYYEAVKNLAGCKTHPLFWLQYAIACLFLSDLERAETYFDTAYSFAQDRDYDTYQIDNHYARFLLLKVVGQGDTATCMAAFREARRIIHQQIQRERLHYPYRVATGYKEFWDKFGSGLTPQERTEVAGSAAFVAERIQRLAERYQSQRHVADCRAAMQYVIRQASTSKLDSAQ